MKKIFLYLSLFLLLSTSLFSQQIDFKSDWKQLARNFIEKYYALEFDYCYAQFDTTVQKQFPKDLFKQAYSQTEFRYGKFVKILETTLAEEQGYHLTSTVIEHEKGKYIMQITYFDNKKIIGFFFKPYTDPKESNSGYKIPNYADTSKFSIVNLKFGEKYKLDAKLTLPKVSQKVPALILVHGSGPNDMDETIGPNKPFKDIAYGLATNGIAVLRYNKRTFQYNNEMALIRNEITLYEETIEDVIFAFNSLKSRPDIDSTKIFILGHSLGGLAIPKIAQLNPSANGFILMAAANQPLEDKFLEQYTYISKLKNNQGIDSTTLKLIAEQVQKVKNQEYGDNIHPETQPLGLSAAYWQYLEKYKPLELITKITKPILVIQGERDYQVTEKEFNIWESVLESHNNSKFILYPKLNHLFLEGEKQSTPEEYGIPSNIPEYVIKDISEWILSN
jgi:dienelactone hydrolase